MLSDHELPDDPPEAEHVDVPELDDESVFLDRIELAMPDVPMSEDELAAYRRAIQLFP